jgi:hypothetical protein
LLLLDDGLRRSFDLSILTINVFIINHGCIHVIFIVNFISTENGFLVRDPENLPVAPFMGLAKRSANTLKPSV